MEIALERTNGTDFEQFCNIFLTAVIGIELVPLGGVHDGGADAFLGEGLLQSNQERSDNFFQVTTQADHRSKIRHTVARLREVKRYPKVLNYCTSRTVSMIDREEELLSKELNIRVRIRDRKWLISNINHSPQTITAFNSYLSPELSFLDDFSTTSNIKALPDVSARTMCVFLGQEIDRRRGNTDLLEAVTDSLILWALEETDPDEGSFMMRQDIQNKIEGTLPSAKQFIRGVFDDRIRLLASKNNPTGREVRWYKKDDKFCLPYETREIIKDEKVEDEFLKTKIMDLYRQRAHGYFDHDEVVPLSDQVAKVAHRAIELTFEKEGLMLAAFLSSENNESQYDGTISDQVDDAIEEANLTGATATNSREIALEVLRQAFYNSTEEERIYYGKLSRTYTLMFALRSEPKIVEYFKSMSSNLILFVGPDIIVRALSERYLAPEDQMTVNMLRILREAGSLLILTEITVREVQAHINATNSEFQKLFAELEHHVDKEIARHADKILIRSYFYAICDPVIDNSPNNWQEFIGQICSSRKLHLAEESRIEVKNYLVQKFDFEYLDDEDIGKITNENEVMELAAKLKEVKSEEVLAVNDAKHILGIYGKRREMRENHSPNPYGHRTWWLTHENRVRSVTAEMVKVRGAGYIIRPEFILNFIALSPTTEEVRQSYNIVFPTLLGIRLSSRMKKGVFQDVMGRVQDVRKVDGARANAMMIEMSNKLKGDNFKQYETNFNPLFQE
ncbi:MAG: hypothetical protein OXC62_13250 [Aestuariivita sp.]|nr:hypothetical protein [Aestuariivita sp.]